MPIARPVKRAFGACGTIKLATCRGGRGRVANRMITPAFPGYTGRRFPTEIISHAVWLYSRFPLQSAA